MQIADSIEWLRIYWVRGGMPRGRGTPNAVNDPPSSGWQHAFVMRGEKRSTIICPFSLWAYTVSNKCGELVHSKEATGYDPEKVAQMLQDNWRQFQGYGWQRDYDNIALLMKRLDIKVPPQTLKGGEDDTRRRGGKETESQLKKPVKRSGKRGKFLEWFLEGEGYSRSVREAMAQFEMSRSNALSYLYMLQKDHGIGYDLVGDIATVKLPEGCDSPFDEDASQAKPEPAAETETESEASQDDDDSWLD